MNIIDTHVHIWTHDPAFPWAKQTTFPPDIEAHPEMLLQLMQENGVDATVLVQYIGYRWDNSYTATALKSYPDKFMAVCRVDPQDPSAPDHLSTWTEVHGFHGVRLSPGADASGDWFTGPLMIPLFQRAAQLGIPVLILTQPSRLPDLAAIVERVPDVDVVIDHMADCINGSLHDLEILLAMARFPRVFLKLSHVWVNSASAYPWRDTYPRIRQVREVFGVRRIMWGSDWPVCLKHASYTQALSYLRDECDVFSPEDLTWILRKTAMRLWRFPQ